MKVSTMGTVAITTIALLLLTIMAALDYPFNWVFYLTVLGQALLIYMVYRVLVDDYKTYKTFEDFYEDHPIGKESNR
ncbi:membrane protein [Sediminicola sp. YIK13]|uniref:hypothetical protein n=1 Tax=Sediminicola sp. YIK13 TaxID=1453352 RepID=UPI000720C560|nr:hypothetical protein [Sediminicola sp. YIK13]ALM08107.1 membrane protein [Sediminicola sp. YIK13]